MPVVPPRPEPFRSPRAWLERTANVVRVTEPASGGHFAPFEGARTLRAGIARVRFGWDDAQRESFQLNVRISSYSVCLRTTNGTDRGGCLQLSVLIELIADAIRVLMVMRPEC